MNRKTRMNRKTVRNRKRQMRNLYLGGMMSLEDEKLYNRVFEKAAVDLNKMANPEFLTENDLRKLHDAMISMDKPELQSKIDERYHFPFSRDSQSGFGITLREAYCGKIFDATTETSEFAPNSSYYYISNQGEVEAAADVTQYWIQEGDPTGGAAGPPAAAPPAAAPPAAAPEPGPVSDLEDFVLVIMKNNVFDRGHKKLKISARLLANIGNLDSLIAKIHEDLNLPGSSSEYIVSKAGDFDGNGANEITNLSEVVDKDKLQIWKRSNLPVSMGGAAGPAAPPPPAAAAAPPAAAAKPGKTARSGTARTLQEAVDAAVFVGRGDALVNMALAFEQQENVPEIMQIYEQFKRLEAKYMDGTSKVYQPISKVIETLSHSFYQIMFRILPPFEVLFLESKGNLLCITTNGIFVKDKADGNEGPWQKNMHRIISDIVNIIKHKAPYSDESHPASSNNLTHKILRSKSLRPTITIHFDKEKPTGFFGRKSTSDLHEVTFEARGCWKRPDEPLLSRRVGKEIDATPNSKEKKQWVEAKELSAELNDFQLVTLCVFLYKNKDAMMQGSLGPESPNVPCFLIDEAKTDVPFLRSNDFIVQHNGLGGELIHLPTENHQVSPETKDNIEKLFLTWYCPKITQKVALHITDRQQLITLKKNVDTVINFSFGRPDLGGAAVRASRAAKDTRLSDLIAQTAGVTQIEIKRKLAELQETAEQRFRGVSQAAESQMDAAATAEAAAAAAEEERETLRHKLKDTKSTAQLIREVQKLVGGEARDLRTLSEKELIDIIVKNTTFKKSKSKVAKDLTKHAATKVGAVGDAVGGAVGHAANTAVSTVGRGSQAAVSTVEGVANTAVGAVGDVGTAAVSTVGGVANTAVGAVGDVGTAAVSTVGGAANKAKKVAGKAVNALKDPVKRKEYERALFAESQLHLENVLRIESLSWRDKRSAKKAEDMRHAAETERIHESYFPRS